MKFAQPSWLLVGLVVCLFLIWRYRRYNAQQLAALTQFVSPRLFDKLTASLSASRRKLKQALFIAGVACLFVALARPQAGFRWEETHRKGIEMLVAVDTSKSMLAEDVKPHRLGRAKLAVNDLVSKLNGDGVGLLAFAGSAFLQCPITLDYDAFRESLNAIDTSVIPRGGTDIAAAIHEAQAVFNTRTGKERILVLITDGEDLGGEAVAAAKAAAQDGVKIFTVGVGSTTGELLPVPGENGGTDFVKDPSGQIVKSKLDETPLKQIAEATGGMYQPLGQQGQGLTTIYDEGLSQFARHDLASRQTKVYLEQFKWALLAALLCFVSEMLIGTRKRVARKVGAQSGPRVLGANRPASSWTPARTAATAALALFALPAMSHASPTSAEKAYQKGNYAEAAKEYAATLAKQPQKAELQFNLGAAAYKSGDYAKAATGFQNTLKSTEVPVQQSAYYNLGNTQYRVGQKTEQTNPQDTIKTWEEAVKSYDAALQIKPDDADAKFNRDLVQKKLEQLKKQQEQQQKQDQQKQDQQNKDQQKQDQNGQGQAKQDQKPQDQKDQKQDQQQQQAKNGSQGEEKKPSQPDQQTAQNGQQPKPDQGKDDSKPEQSQANQKPDATKGGKVETANGQSTKDQQAQAAADRVRSEPGQMTKEEAKQLLDSLKGEEHKLSAAQFARTPTKPEDNKPIKDW